ncbi:glycine--tRNA ligase, mitochondrial 1 [Arabidopsis lyrata subsp. lyrata]|uniref:glycine--tRNA ligase, mitochondrial 1 n=1 Tax=Arabidopsis lyrata subsp. lyrata TaxID=81972 RepID=UPI000A29AAA1|nr:glycine--tRNA ligase, mitochondrial 1 [Arabidopsis lyrata subsp. lyrata]|eukprot:XP_020875112.1 glycine--tRNA ligase, mitochondrial 1 [Arabidopsis lyrata subsp. lyrata]
MNATEQSLLHAFSKKSSTVEDQEMPIRPLNASSAEKPEIDVAIGGLFDILKAEKSVVEKEPEAFRQAVGNILERRLFYNPSFDIYGGITGLLDYGPSGRLVELNVLSLWRKFFVNEEDMLEVGCSALTPEIVFNASGHVKKFTDLMVKDEVNGAFHRADHLVKGYCESRKKDVTISAEKAAELDNVLAVVEDLSAEELGAKIKEYGITAPHTKNPLSHPPRPFNLMFQTFFGPTGSSLGYLRPETAQGIFVNFMNYYNDNGRKLPLAVAQVGRVFRNEISPRQGPIRAREFLLAEIEHFVDPENKSHPKFPDVELLEFLMFPREEQEKSGQSAKKLCLGEAVAKGTVNSETLGYFIGRVYLFLVHLGIDKERLRFRQHKAKEMAHYAADCWDAEIECSYGWIECVGIADRSAYDLCAHSEKSGVSLVAEAKLAEPKEIEKLVITPVKKELGVAFKADQKNVVEALEAMNEQEAMELKATLESKGEAEFEVCTLGKNVTIKKNMVSISKKRTEVRKRFFTPSVIEPSFGIGRIMYCLYEHCFSTRPSKAGDEQLNVFRFSPLVAPFKCTVLPLVQNQQLEEAAKVISKQLKSDGIKHKIEITVTLKQIETISAYIFKKEQL